MTSDTVGGTEVAMGETHGWDGQRAEAAGMRALSRRPPLPAYLRELWQRREFILLLPRSELTKRNMNNVLGNLWHLLNPLMLAAVFYLVFGVLFAGRESEEVFGNYSAFLLIGVFIFTFTQKCLNAGASVVVNNVRLLRNINFPAAVLPISAVLTEAYAQFPALFALLAMVALTGEMPALVWLAVFLLLPFQLLMNLGLTFISARLTVHFRDTESLLPYLTRIWLYLSGVLIGIDRIPEGWPRTVFQLNPAYAYIRLNRTIIFEGRVETDVLLIAAAWTVGLLLGGLLYFHRFESEYSNAVIG